MKMDKVNVDNRKLRSEVTSLRLNRRAQLRKLINAGIQEINKVTRAYDLDGYCDTALSLILSGRVRDVFDLSQELARCLVEAGTRVVEAIWPKVANHS